MVIKEEGWAIKSVEWVPYADIPLFGNYEYNPLIDPPYISPFAQRAQIGIYADVDAYPQQDQTLTHYTYADVKVIIEGLIPQGGAYVMLEKIDPPNDYLPNELRLEDDNVNENFSWMDSSVLHFIWSEGDEPVMATELQHTLAVGTYAGNNYIIKANKCIATQSGLLYNYAIDPDEINNYVLSNKTLTVWRRLWMETDAVAGAGALDDSLLKREMQKACISVMDLNYTSSPIPDTPMTVSTNQLNLGMVDASKNNQNLFSSNSFWYLHAIAAKKLLIVNGNADKMTIYKDQFGNITNIHKQKISISNDYGALGVAIDVHNTNMIKDTVFVFNETIENRAGTEHPEHTIVTNDVSSPYIYPDASTLKKDTLLHEIVHMFGIGDNERGLDDNIIYDIMCYTYNSTEGPAPVIAYEHIKKMQQCTYPSTTKTPQPTE